MLFRVVLVFSILFFSCSKEISRYSSKEKPSKKVIYKSLLDRVKNNDLSVNFKTLRLLYTNEPDYNVYYYDVEDISSLNVAFRNNQYKKALKYANKILKKKFVDPETHFICSVIYKKLSNSKKYDYHYNISKGLF
jgi:predicted Zn-dependent protease